MVDYLKQVIGYTLTGSVSEKALFVLHGDGDNGKTTLLEAVREILGDYAGTVEINHLMQTASTSEQLHAIAGLQGLRFVTASEAEEGQKLNEAKIKHLTGMGQLTGRHLYQNAFEFTPRFKLFIDANHKPVIRGSDNAIWRRIRLVPFKVSIPKGEQDRELLSKLKNEAPGILRWAVQGCVELQEVGQLENPKAVSDAVEEYRQEMDVVQHFIDECCDVEKSSKTLCSALHRQYEHWCEVARETPMSMTAFGKWLGKHGYDEVRSSTARMRQGLRLKASTDCQPAHQPIAA
jgi:putative DNA primase/helicase